MRPIRSGCLSRRSQAACRTNESDGGLPPRDVAARAIDTTRGREKRNAFDANKPLLPDAQQLQPTRSSPVEARRAYARRSPGMPSTERLRPPSKDQLARTGCSSFSIVCETSRLGWLLYASRLRIHSAGGPRAALYAIPVSPRSCALVLARACSASSSTSSTPSPPRPPPSFPVPKNARSLHQNRCSSSLRVRSERQPC